MKRLVIALLWNSITGGCGYDAGTLVDASIHLDAPPAPGGGARDAGIPGVPSDAGRPADGGEPVPACSNGEDDDCDGHVDHAGGDPGCAGASDGDERGPGLICDDGIDNDGDQLIDFASPECGGGDPGCDSPSDSTELTTPRPAGGAGEAT